MEAFQNDLKELALYALFYAIVVLRFVTVKPELAPDVTELVKDGFSFMDEPCDELKLYEDRLNGVIEDYIKYGYLNID